MELSREDTRIRQRRGAQGLEIGGKTSLDETADLVRSDQRSGRLDEMHVHPIVGIEEHQQTATVFQDHSVNGMGLASPVPVVRAYRLGRPVSLQEGEARIGWQCLRPVMPRDNDTEVLIRLGEHGGQGQIEQRFDPGPMPSVAVSKVLKGLERRQEAEAAPYEMRWY